ncbi:uncharacterized protein LOC130635881 isoform X1 [Hydractinia symbiolongicarpus]|uniref:uncharacterized protein LOC130635881 isoform X1 n=1 Tax=Hydractinia symbiolongicarpus TaxID=13093 RepID=UPI0025508461|nr:uncharacterized protein LOC130635881 isoform X1 [Hydractinia symbiolongicarpus]
MLYHLVLLMIFLLNEIRAHANVKVVELLNNVTLTATYASFKKHENVTIYGVEIKVLNVQTKVQCASQCIKTEECNTFAIRKNTPPPFYCGLFTGNLDTNHYYAMDDNEFDVYETQNMCTLNPLICEHGSVCIPNFNNNTYYCKWCFPPYHGKHCNVTAETVNKEAIPEDIRTGKNASCRSLKKYFGPQKTFVPVVTYPWRDNRKLVVICHSDGSTQISKIYINQHGPLYDRVSTLTKLSDMKTSAYRISTTALNMLYKLIRFKRIQFVCRGSGTSQGFMTSSIPSTNVVSMLKYFIGESNDLPDSCGTFKWGERCEIMKNQKWSKEGIPYETRIYNEIFRLDSNVTEGFSMADHKYGCLNEFGAYKAGESYALWVY